MKDIESLRDDVIISQFIGDGTGEIRRKYAESKMLASKPYVLWQLDFARVFREKGGFDIVIEKGFLQVFQLRCQQAQAAEK